jgi:hypothetical protein
MQAVSRAVSRALGHVCNVHQIRHRNDCLPHWESSQEFQILSIVVVHEPCSVC